MSCTVYLPSSSKSTYTVPSYPKARGSPRPARVPGTKGNNTTPINLVFQLGYVHDDDAHKCMVSHSKGHLYTHRWPL